jgi:hypothetical protein
MADTENNYYPESLEVAGQPSPATYSTYSTTALPVRSADTSSANSTVSTAAYIPRAGFRSSRRIALVVSVAITILVTLLTAGSLALLGRRSAEKIESNSVQNTVPRQTISPRDKTSSPALAELKNESGALLVNGNLITRGVVKVTSGSYATVIRPLALSADRVVTLPDADGTLCLSGNNCGYVTTGQAAQTQVQMSGLQGRVTALESQLGQIVVPTTPVTTTINGLGGAIAIQGTSRQISVSTVAGVVTLSTPQDLASISSPTFANLILSGNFSLGGALNLPIDCSAQASGGKLTTDNTGQVICDDDDSSGGGATVGSPGGTAGRLALFTAAQTIADSIISEALGTITVGGNAAITGSLSANSLTLTTALSVANGGTGTTTFTANGVVYGNGAGALLTTAVPASGQVLLGNGSGVPTFTTLSGDVAVTGAGVTTIQTNSISLGVDTVGDYIQNLGVLTGLTTGGNSGEGSTPTLSVVYGSTSDSAVEGDTTVTCSSGSGNLTGGGNTITLGTGGACGALSTVNNPTFTTSVTTPLLQSSGALSITPNGALTIGAIGQTTLLQGSVTTITSTGAGNDVILTSADQIRLTGFNCTTFANGGALTTDASGNLSCADDDGGAGGAVSTAGGTTNRIALFSGAQAIADSWLLQNGSTLQLDNTRNLSLLGGNFDVTGTGTFSGLLSANGSFTIENGDTFTFNGDAFTDLTGTGLVVSSGSLQTTLGTSVDLGSEITGTLGVTNGGTGLSSAPTNGQLLIGNGTGYTLATLTQGAGMTITNASGSITVASAFGASIDLGSETTGDYQLSTSAGNGISVSGSAAPGWTPTVSLGALTADWSQTGAFDIVLNNAGSELRILESAGATFFGALDAGDLTADRTYTLPDASGTICLTTGNCAGSGSGVTTPGGTTDRLSKFTGAQAIGDSSISDDGSTVTINGSVDLVLQGGLATLGTTSQAGTLDISDGSSNTVSIVVTALAGDHTYTLPDAGGDATFCLSTGNCIGGGGGGAPNNATYLLTSLDGTLSSERALAAGSNISFTDGGANGNFTVATVQNPTFTTSVTTPLLQSSGALTLTSAAGNTIAVDAGTTIELQDSTNVTGSVDISSALTAGSTNSFQVNSSGAIAAATGITSSGTIIFSSLNCSGNGNGGALTTNGSGQLMCSDDDGGSGSAITGTGTSGAIPLFNGAQTITDSIITQSGTTITIAGDLTLSTDLTVANGGTGASSFTSNGVLYGNGTGAFGVTAAGTTGQCFLGNTGSAPSWGTCPTGAGGVSLQGSTPGTPDSGNFNVSGTGIAGTALLTPLIDTPSGTTTLNVGTTNATTGINLNQNTTLLGGKSFLVDQGSSATALQVETASGGQLFTVDQNNSRVTVGGTTGCAGPAGGRLCLNQTVTSAGTSIQHNNTMAVATSSGATQYATYMNITDTSSAIANTTHGLYMDFTGTTNNSATQNGITVLGRTQNAGNLLNLQAGGASVLTVSNAGAITMQGSNALILGTSGSANGGITFNSSNASANTILLQAPTNMGTTARTITLPDASGTVAVSASGNIAISAAGNITFTGTLGVTDGGTGTGTFTSNGVLYGNGTGAIGVTAAGTTNQCLLANTGAAPTWGTCSAAGSVSLQGSTPGSPQTGHFNITGTGIAGTLLATNFDTTSAVTLNIGQSTASAINLGEHTTLADGKTLTVGVTTGSGGIGGNVTVNGPSGGGTALSVVSQNTTGHTLSVQGMAAQTGSVLRARTNNGSSNVDTFVVLGEGNLQTTAAALFMGGTSTEAYRLSLSGAVSTNAGNVYGIQNQIGIVSSLGTSTVYGMINLPTIDSTSANISNVVGFGGRVDIEAGYSGTIPEASAIYALQPGALNGTKIADYAGLHAMMPSSNTNSNSGNTTGNINNYGLWVEGAGALAAGSGTLFNYAAYLNLSTGNSAATTNTGLHIAGNGGATATNYAIRSTSTAQSTLAGSLSVGTSSTTAFQVQNASGFSALTADTGTGYSLNLITNSNFETNTAGWAANGAATISHTTSQRYLGTDAMQVVSTGTGDGAKFNVTLAGSTNYTVQFYAKLNSGTFTTMAFGYASDGATETTCRTGQTVVTSGWTSFNCTFNTGAVSGTPYFFIKQTGTGAKTYFIDVAHMVLGTNIGVYEENKLKVEGAISSPLAIQNTEDSNSAFQIQDRSLNTVFDVDTLNNRVGIGTMHPAAVLNIENISGSDDMLRVNALAGGGILARFQVASTDVFSIGASGAVISKNSANSTAAFQVQNTSNVSQLLVDTSNARVYVGPTAGDTVGSLLVLGKKTSYTGGSQAGDPTGVVGGMYYNSALGEFRCYEVDHWRACLQSARTSFRSIHEMFGTASNGDISAGSANGGSVANSSTAGLTGHPGINTANTGTAGSTGYGTMWLDDSNGTAILLGNGDYWRYETVVRIPTLSTAGERYIMRAGFINGPSDGTNGCYVRYSDNVNGGRFQGYCVSNSTTSTCDMLTTAAINTWYRFTVVVNAAGNSVDFKINGTSQCQVSSNIPTAAGRETSMQTMIHKTVGSTNRTLEIDYVELEGQFGSSR